MSTNPVHWFEIYVTEIGRAKAFYEAVFQLQLEEMPSDEVDAYLTFPMHTDRVGAGGALAKMEGMAPGAGGGTLVYFNCEDCSVEEGRVEPAGGVVIQPKRAIPPYGYISLINDTEGNLIGLHSQT